MLALIYDSEISLNRPTLLLRVHSHFFLCGNQKDDKFGVSLRRRFSTKDQGLKSARVRKIAFIRPNKHAALIQKRFKHFIVEKKWRVE